jgi:hypothetical protein
VCIVECVAHTVLAARYNTAVPPLVSVLAMEVSQHLTLDGLFRLSGNADEIRVFADAVCCFLERTNQCRCCDGRD